MRGPIFTFINDMSIYSKFLNRSAANTILCLSPVMYSIIYSFVLDNHLIVSIYTFGKKMTKKQFDV